MEMSLSKNKTTIERENRNAVADDEQIFDKFVVKMLNIYTSDEFMKSKFSRY